MPQGTYARDIELFVTPLGFTPMESILAATAGVAKLFMREDELGKIKEGYSTSQIVHSWMGIHRRISRCCRITGSWMLL